MIDFLSQIEILLLNMFKLLKNPGLLLKFLEFQVFPGSLA